MNFELSEEQQLLQQNARAFVKQRSPLSRARKLRDGALDRALWREMGDLGWLSLPFAEDVGGFGGNFVDVAVLLEVFGSTLVPEPYLASIVLAGTVLARAGTPDQHQRWLSAMMEGRTIVALAHDEPGHRFSPRPHSAVAVAVADGYRLRGRKEFVLGGQHADVFVISALVGGEPALFVVPCGTEGLTVRSIRTIDGQGAAMLEFDSHVPSDQRLTGGDPGDALDRGLDAAAAMTVAEGLGVCRSALELTLSHLKTREQFGVPIGSFQALQHRAVEMFVEVELVRSILALAAARADHDNPDVRHHATSSAKVQLAMSGRFVAQQAVQLHGGIGITDEHDIGLYFKRMHALTLAFGDEEHHVRRFGARPAFTDLRANS